MVANKPATLICRAEGSQTPKITWYHNDQLVGGGGDWDDGDDDCGGYD